MSTQVNSSDCSVCNFKSLFFETLQEDGLKKLNSCKTQFNFKKGDIICNEGDTIGSIIFINRGLIKLHKKVSETQNQILSIARPLNFIGLLSVFSKEEFHYSLTAIEDSSVCYISRECILNEISTNGKFALDIITKISKVTDEVLEQKFALSKKRLRGRIAHILLDFAENIYHSNQFDLPVSRSEIAELIDMRTENVIRIMSEFRADGIIRTNGHNIEIMKPDVLKKISKTG
jgi:CRP/FNR family transcriptional regulator